MDNLTHQSYDPETYTLIAQKVICAYPISDTYAPTPRYLYYALLALSFVLPHRGWLAKIFLGGATAYAATAAINVFIIVGDTGKRPVQSLVSIPSLPDNFTSPGLNASTGLVVGQSDVIVKPDALELDLDAILAIVVTAYLTGLPMQAWSWTARSSRTLHYMILVWNALMLAAAITALVTWPQINTSPTQYRFCYSGALDPAKQPNDQPDAPDWQGDWNSTIQYIFSSDPVGNFTAWDNLTDNCVYPCFTTRQTLRQTSSLIATIMEPGQRFAKLHDEDHWQSDGFGGLIYASIMAFTAAQIFLLLVGRFRLCSRHIPIYEPVQLWLRRGLIKQHFHEAIKESWRVSTGGLHKVFSKCIPRSRSSRTAAEASSSSDIAVRAPLRLLADLLTVFTLVVTMTLFPVTIISFIAWIEWYIRNDGKPGETFKQVGQWSPLVSVGIVVLAGLAFRFRKHLGSRGELMGEIEECEARLESLRNELHRRDQQVIKSVAAGRGDESKV